MWAETKINILAGFFVRLRIAPSANNKMSQKARELTSRFAHLLQPIKDLTKNWDIDVASQLEEYIEEVSNRAALSEYTYVGS